MLTIAYVLCTIFQYIGVLFTGFIIGVLVQANYQEHQKKTRKRRNKKNQKLNETSKTKKPLGESKN